MHCALRFIALSQDPQKSETLLILDAAIYALERAGDQIGAANVDLAKQRFMIITAPEASEALDGLCDFG